MNSTFYNTRLKLTWSEYKLSTISTYTTNYLLTYALYELCLLSWLGSFGCSFLGTPSWMHASSKNFCRTSPLVTSLCCTCIWLHFWVVVKATLFLQLTWCRCIQCRARSLPLSILLCPSPFNFTDEKIAVSLSSSNIRFEEFRYEGDLSLRIIIDSLRIQKVHE